MAEGGNQVTLAAGLHPQHADPLSSLWKNSTSCRRPFAPGKFHAPSTFIPSPSIADFLADAPTKTRINEEAALGDKLRNIEALFPGTVKAGEKKAAAGAAALLHAIRRRAFVDSTLT